ncbi:MAG: glycosyl hydrolase family 5, partial [Candidatus Sulfotelmatobacter sp.]
MQSMVRSLSTAVLTCLMVAAHVATAQKVTVDADPAHVANTYSPVHSLGAAIDRLRTGTPDHLLKDPLLKEILGAGWQTVTYRQNTELMVEAWHWNPTGKWSNPDKQEGYFTGSPEPGEEIHSSWAYPLPHRGFSRGDGNGWSRLTDGDIHSYWKSNPYLTKAFTGEDDSLHPQWVMIDLGTKIDV